MAQTLVIAAKQLFSNFAENHVGDEGLKIICEAIGWKLYQLILSQCQITWIGIKFLVDYNLQKINTLWLDQNKIRCKGLKLLIKGNFPLLMRLYLGGCQIGNQGARNLSKAQWKNLATLQLDQNKITIYGEFCQNNNKNLRQLYLYSQQDAFNMFPFILTPSYNLKIVSSVRNQKLKLIFEKIIENRFNQYIYF